MTPSPKMRETKAILPELSMTGFVKPSLRFQYRPGKPGGLLLKP